MPQKFVSEPLEPLTAGADTALMASGEPGLPRAFRWRGQVIEVQTLLRRWHETGPCSHGSPERYLRRHWFEVETDRGRMRIYFERQPRRGKKEPRWWLFSLEGTAETGG